MSYGIVANVMAADSCLRLGARVIVIQIPGNPDHVLVRGITRSGRVVEKWTARNRLHRFRPAWIHKPDRVGHCFAARDEAAAEIVARFGAGSVETSPASAPSD